MLRVWWILVPLSLAGAEPREITLRPIPGSEPPQRWLDAAGRPYGAAFQRDYGYHLAAVTVTYDHAAPVLRGRLVARGLKPNFAYQLKLEAPWGSPALERLGRVGRYWRETWRAGQWVDGWNLNDKGDGASPSPNDRTFAAQQPMVDATSPTGLRYRFKTYLLFAYFVSDPRGRAEMDFAVDRCWHVLWRLDQRRPTADDGPTVSATFDGDPVSDRAYDQAHDPVSVGLYGEWERRDGATLAPGDYALSLQLTEESFHEQRPLAGSWAGVMAAPVEFVITPPA